jgi:hypothetical protein
MQLDNPTANLLLLAVITFLSTFLIIEKKKRKSRYDRDGDQRWFCFREGEERGGKEIQHQNPHPTTPLD